MAVAAFNGAVIFYRQVGARGNNARLEIKVIIDVNHAVKCNSATIIDIKLFQSQCFECCGRSSFYIKRAAGASDKSGKCARVVDRKFVAVYGKSPCRQG